MQRRLQTEKELLELIASIDVDWRDAHFEAVWQLLDGIPKQESYNLEDVGKLLDDDFDAATTTLRLILDMSKDTFLNAMKHKMGRSSVSKTSFRTDREGHLRALESLGVSDELNRLAGRGYT